MRNESVFFGPAGLRIGWRVVFFVALMAAVYGLLAVLWRHPLHSWTQRYAAHPAMVGAAGVVVAAAIALGIASLLKPQIFFGPKGMRAGWRLLFLLVLVAIIGQALNAIWIAIFHKHGPQNTIEAGLLVIGGVGNVLTVLIALLVLARIDKVSVASYGFPLRRAFRGRFWVGGLWGFGALSLLMLCIKGLHGVDLGAIRGGAGYEAKEAVLFAIGFVLVGLFEELLMRSYMLFSLARGMRFWPGAIVTAIIFGAAHSGNPGEQWYGLLAVVAVGILFCLFVRRTGDLWFVIGFHFTWDWAETYFYGTPDSGITATGSLFHSQFHGPAWVTGGTVGPEGSALCFAVIVITGIVFHAIYRKDRYFPEMVETPGAMGPAMTQGSGEITIDALPA